VLSAVNNRSVLGCIGASDIKRSAGLPLRELEYPWRAVPADQSKFASNGNLQMLESLDGAGSNDLNMAVVSDCRSRRTAGSQCGARGDHQLIEPTHHGSL
jgi:hypothetical protein